MDTSFKQLYLQYYAPAKRFATLYVKRSDVAEDVVQDVFLTAGTSTPMQLFYGLCNDFCEAWLHLFFAWRATDYRVRGKLFGGRTKRNAMDVQST